MTKTVLGMFQEYEELENAIDKFKSEGFKPEDFSIVMEETNGVKEILLAVPTRENQLELVMTIFDDSNASDVKTISQEASGEDRKMPTHGHTSHHTHHAFAHAHDRGEKGGKVAGKGWHGDSKEHAAAAKSKTTTSRKTKK